VPTLWAHLEFPDMSPTPEDRPLSRSQLKRIAIQKGHPMPEDFDGPATDRPLSDPELDALERRYYDTRDANETNALCGDMAAALRQLRRERDELRNQAATEGSPEARANSADCDRMIAERERDDLRQTEQELLVLARERGDEIDRLSGMFQEAIERNVAYLAQVASLRAANTALREALIAADKWFDGSPQRVADEVHRIVKRALASSEPT
jgi:hypothetical protein